MKYLQSLKNSVWRIILVIAGLLHILIFFTLPYAKMSGLAGSIAGFFGGESDLTNLTGYTIINDISGIKSTLSQLGFGGYANLFVFLAILPLILGIALAVISIFLEGRKCYSATLVLSVIHLLSYVAILISTIILSESLSGSSSGLLNLNIISFDLNAFTYVLVFLLSVFQIFVSASCRNRDEVSTSCTVVSTKPIHLPSKKSKTEFDSDFSVTPEPFSANGTITGLSGNYLNAVLPVMSGSSIVIGRDPAFSHIIVDNGEVSRRHCEITYEKETGMYIVTDLSKNGTYYDSGQRLPANRPVRMYPGSKIKIGEGGDVFLLG